MNTYFDYPESPSQAEISYDDKLEQFTKAFDINETKEINDFFKKYGFVIIKNIVSVDDCDKTEKEIMELMKFNKNKSSSYTKWASFGKENEGLVSRKPLFTPQILNNRQNEKIYNIFSRLLTSTNLQVTHESCYFLRPTRNVKFEDNSIKSVDEWKTQKSIRLDIDINKCYNKPDELINILQNMSYINLTNFMNETCIFTFLATPLNIEGLINLSNNRELDGGFSCVPGFHKYFNEWYNHCSKNLLKKNNTYISSLKSDIDNTIYKKYIFDENDPIKNRLVKINMKLGSLIIWDQRLPYCIEPNNSNNFWLAQQIKYSKKYNFVNNSRMQIIKSNLLNIQKYIQINKILQNLY
jgi:ectoine hydroxylase-related dioxygenase (phytanoyl-CoA dioxygenase family)